MRPALVLTLFALAAAARGQDGPLKSKPEKVT